MSAVESIEARALRDLELRPRIPSVTFVHASNLLAHPQPLTWDIRGIFLHGTIVSLIGAAGTFKSNAAIDIAASIATGSDWHGQPTRSGPVFYLAGEGNAGIARRLKAWEIYRDTPLTSAPLYISAGGIGLIDPLSAEAVAAEVERLSRLHAPRPALVVIDTLARNFGPGDENSASDMGKFIENIDRKLREPYGCTVLVVHHTGVTDTGRARGSSAFKAAIDTEITFDRTDRMVTLRCMKSKDAPEFEPLAFEARTIMLPWNGEDGEPESSFVLHACEVPRSEAKATVGLGENQRKALQALRDLYAEQRQRLTSTGHNPDSALVLIDDWQARIGIQRQRFHEVKNTLESKHLIRLDGKYVHLQASE